jgi:hypothetical protein
MTIPDRIAAAVPPFVMALAVPFAAAQLYIGLTNDTKLFMAMARHLLEDGGLYARWFEVNPPLIVLLYSLPTAMTLWLRVPAHLSLTGCTLLLALWSLFAQWNLIRASALQRQQRLLLIAAGAGMLIILPVNAAMFGDREHLLMILTLPWVLQMLLGQQPSWKLAAVAAVGFCLKPYNLVIPLLLLAAAGARTWRQRIFSPSALAMAAVAAAYAAVIFVWFPGYVANVLPLVETAYPYTRAPLENKFLYPPFLILPTLLLLCAGLPRERYAAGVWWGWTMGMWFSFFGGGGWLYTYYLLLCPLLMAAVNALQTADGQGTLRCLGRWAALAITGCMLLLSLFSLMYNLQSTWLTGNSLFYTRLPPPMYRELREAAGERFILLSQDLWGVNLTDISDAPPLHVFGFESLWPLPWLVAHPGDPKHAAIMQPMAASLVAALALRPSPALLVDASPRKDKLPDGFDILGYLHRRPEIDSALQGYIRIKTVDYCTVDWNYACRFDVWMRPDFIQ